MLRQFRHIPSKCIDKGFLCRPAATRTAAAVSGQRTLLRKCKSTVPNRSKPRWTEAHLVDNTLLILPTRVEPEWSKLLLWLETAGLNMMGLLLNPPVPQAQFQKGNCVWITLRCQKHVIKWFYSKSHKAKIQIHMVFWTIWFIHSFERFMSVSAGENLWLDKGGTHVVH